MKTGAEYAAQAKSSAYNKLKYSQVDCQAFCELVLSDIGVKTVICTDISKDGAMQGPNHNLYQEMAKQLDMQIIASGGVYTIADIRRLASMNIHGAILGKAYYTGAVDLSEAIEVAK